MLGMSFIIRVNLLVRALCYFVTNFHPVAKSMFLAHMS